MVINFMTKGRTSASVCVSACIIDDGMSNVSVDQFHLSILSQTLHQLFIINAGSRFRMLWKVIKAFLDASKDSFSVNFMLK